jgi:hypothetical protein
MRRGRLGIIAAALLLYAASLLTPALQFDGVENGVAHVMKGYEVALLGWQGIFVANFGWVANLIFFVSLPLVWMGSWRPAVVFAGLALLIALQSLVLLGRTLPGDEGGVTHMVLSRLHPGFYLWMGAIVLALAGSLWARAHAGLPDMQLHREPS